MFPDSGGSFHHFDYLFTCLDLRVKLWINRLQHLVEFKINHKTSCQPCNCRSKLVSQLTNGQLNSKCDDTRRTLVCTGLLGKQGNQHHITGYGNESQQCLQSETVN